MSYKKESYKMSAELKQKLQELKDQILALKVHL